VVAREHNKVAHLRDCWRVGRLQVPPVRWTLYWGFMY